METRIKLWIGMGAWLLASASPAALNAAETRTTIKVTGSGHTALAQAPAADPAHKGHGGEGGEAGEANVFADASPDEALLGRLLLIKGHLFVGKELYDSGRFDDALPHYLHPAEEIYEELEPELKARKARQFEGALKRLVDLVKSKASKEAVAEEQKKVLAAIEAASRAVPSKVRFSPEFNVKVAVLMLKSAVNEYEEAIEDGKIANPVEYQDSRGFVWMARDLLVGARKELQARDAEAYKLMMGQIDKLRAAWPSVLPPPAPKLSFGEVQAAVSQIELRASRFH